MNKLVTRAREVDPPVETLGKIGLRPAVVSQGQKTVFFSRNSDHNASPFIIGHT